MEYWIIINEKPNGPHTIDALRAMGLDPNTLVWRSGLNEWIPLSSLSEWFVATPPQPQYYAPQPQHQASPQPQYQAAPQPSQPTEPKPATYLGWSIASAVLCCTPLSIGAIIMSVLVNKRYNRGDVAGAHKMSEWAQILIILSIVLGLVWMPFSVVFNTITQAIGL